MVVGCVEVVMVVTGVGVVIGNVVGRGAGEAMSQHPSESVKAELSSWLVCGKFKERNE